MQNFSYAPALRDLSHTIHMQSPAAYKLLRTAIPMEAPRTIRYFPSAIGPEILWLTTRFVGRQKANRRSFQLYPAFVHLFSFEDT